MNKVSKAYVLVVAGLLAILSVTAGASAAFGFSSPVGSIVAGPGLATAGPTTFNTYYHDSNMANSGVATDVAVNGVAGGFSPLPGCLPAIPWGVGPIGAYGNAANAMATGNCAEDTTFATSFSTAGGVGLGLGGVHFAGTIPEFSLNLF